MSGEQPTFSEASRVWAEIGLTSFGGPAGQIALMHRKLVEETGWLDEKTFLVALNFCTLLPGPEAMQLATYCGWRLHGVKGGLAAGLFFILPGALVILALSMLYAHLGAVPMVAATFTGIKAAVLAIVVEALIRIARRSLGTRAEWALAALSFAGLFFFRVPFPFVILAAGLFGFWNGRADTAEAPQLSRRVNVQTAITTALVWLAIWLLPLAVMAGVLGGGHVLSQLAVFFSKMAVVTFGGAYAVLAYLAQDAVNVYGWLKPGEMLDGLGLAETTPGPLILVTEFVGLIAAYRSGGVAMGVAGAAVTLWATFVPSFLFIFTGAPYIDRLKSAPRLQSGLRAITAAVVGVIFNLSLWFALHVIFRHVDEVHFGTLRVIVPEPASVDVIALFLAVLAGLLLLRFRFGVISVLGVCAALGFVAAMAG